MKNKKSTTMRCRLVIAFILAAVFAAAEDYAVGKITSFTGEIWLDPFGSGNFKKIEKPGEPLYKNSILKTGNTAKALIMVMDTPRDVLPRSIISVETIISLETRKKNAPWFSPLVDILHRITGFLFPGEKSVDFISRGAEKLSAYDNLFRFEEEGDESADLTDELNFLLEIRDPEESGYTPGEYDYRKAFCYFQLGNYEAAAGLFDSAYRLSGKAAPQSAGAPWFTNSLFLLKGINHYMLAEYENAGIFLEKFVNLNKESEYTPYATWLLLDALVNLKQKEKVQEYLVMVRDYFKDHRYKAEFAIYLEGMKQSAY